MSSSWKVKLNGISYEDKRRIILSKLTKNQCNYLILNGKYILKTSVIKNDYKIVKKLLKIGLNVHFKYANDPIFFIAVKYGYFNIINLFILAKFDINSSGMYQNALFFIISKEKTIKREKIVKYLLKLKINLNILNKLNISALMYTLNYNRLQITIILLKRGAIFFENDKNLESFIKFCFSVTYSKIFIIKDIFNRLSKTFKKDIQKKYEKRFKKKKSEKKLKCSEIFILSLTKI